MKINYSQKFQLLEKYLEIIPFNLEFTNNLNSQDFPYFLELLSYFSCFDSYKLKISKNKETLQKILQNLNFNHKKINHLN